MNTQQLTRKILKELGARANVMYGDSSFEAVLELIEDFTEQYEQDWQRQQTAFDRQMDSKQLEIDRLKAALKERKAVQS